ncbi:MAG: glycosyltransferase [Solobacterium sp.]|nr:glycosyltransferase [Solobacterium sp.]
MEQILLSIIIPLYNGGKFIEQLVNNIVLHNSDSFPYEIILVNDGSPDNTADVCRGLTQKYSNIKYVEKENGGIASARNAGLEHAAGMYITFADQDDTVIAGYKPFIEKCIADNLDMLVTSSYNKRINDEKISKRTFPDMIINDTTMIKKIAGKLIDGDFLSDDSAPFISVSVWNALYRKGMILENNTRFKVFIDYEDDWIFNIENLINAKKIALSSEGYYCWIIREGSESHRTKYIKDLLAKRKNWMVWISEIIEKLGIEPSRAESFIRDVLIPRNIMMCFNNACWNDKASETEKFKEISEALGPEGWNIASVKLGSVKEMSASNKLLLRILKQNHVKLAYYCNRSVFKNRFH